jgi:hypothetical protein
MVDPDSARNYFGSDKKAVIRIHKPGFWAWLNGKQQPDYCHMGQSELTVPSQNRICYRTTERTVIEAKGYSEMMASAYDGAECSYILMYYRSVKHKYCFAVLLADYVKKN